jgi:hypothetical protein
MVNRRGGTKLGCLATLIVVGAVGYFGFTIGKQYLRYYQFKDAMEQQAHFAASRSDAVILGRLRALVDSLGLPESAKNISVRRANNVIFIYTNYYVPIEFPGYVKEIHFAPQAMGPL